MRKRTSLRQQLRRLRETTERIALERDSSLSDGRRLASENYRLRLRLAQRTARKWYNPFTWLR